MCACSFVCVCVYVYVYVCVSAVEDDQHFNRIVGDCFHSDVAHVWVCLVFPVSARAFVVRVRVRVHAPHG
jgi:hypothetical protein